MYDCGFFGAAQWGYRPFCPSCPVGISSFFDTFAIFRYPHLRLPGECDFYRLPSAQWGYEFYDCACSTFTTDLLGGYVYVLVAGHTLWGYGFLFGTFPIF